jgi:hypothetical protein
VETSGTLPATLQVRYTKSASNTDGRRGAQYGVASVSILILTSTADEDMDEDMDE